MYIVEARPRLLEQVKLLAVGHAVRTVGCAKRGGGYGTARRAYVVCVLIYCALLAQCYQLILQDKNLINVARVAPCYDACYIAVALAYGTMQTLLCYSFTQGVFLLQRVVQMCVGADSILLLQYGHVKATSQRLYRPLAVSALHIVGKCQGSEHSRFGE